MPKQTAFKPCLINYYLVQGPHKVTGEQTLGITTYNGKASDGFRNMPFSFKSDVSFAALGQHHIESVEEGQKWYAYYRDKWVKPYDLSPIEETPKSETEVKEE